MTKSEELQQRSQKQIWNDLSEETRERLKANLRPFNTLSPEEHKELCSKGGKQAAKNKEYNRTFKQALEWALELPAMKGNPDVNRLRKQFANLTNRDAIVIALTAKAIKEGDVRAFTAIRDTTGEIPAQTVNVQNQEPIKITIETVE